MVSSRPTELAYYSTASIGYSLIAGVSKFYRAMDFRIIRKEETNGNGESKVYFLIQKKFLFWWFSYGIKTHYFTYTNWNAHLRNMPTHMAHITKRLFLFNSEGKAKEVLTKIQNPFTEKYKGENIGIVFHDNTLEDVYINWSYSGSWYGGHGYEHSTTLDGLKALIDRRKVKTKISVVCERKRNQG